MKEGSLFEWVCWCMRVNTHVPNSALCGSIKVDISINTDAHTKARAHMQAGVNP